jgi:serine-protein kinase ATM
MRLSASDTIIDDLLEPASKSLRDRSIAHGQTAGKVFFEYAIFCTIQLEDQHAIADIKRMESLYRNKQNEALQYTNPMKSAQNQADESTLKKLQRDYERATKQAKMDKDELQRLQTSQRVFLVKAMENFLRCFAACSDFDRHVPKFCAIWLKHSKQPGINDIAAAVLGTVPSYKFLPLLHQLFSRLLDAPGDEFQHCLSDLLCRISNEHPFHAVHQLFSTSFSNDEAVSQSRSSAAKQLAERMSPTHKVGNITVKELSTRLYGVYSTYSDLANVPLNKKDPPRTEYQMSSYPSLKRFRSKDLANLPSPPPSLEIPVSPDGDYTAVPFVQKYHQSFWLAGGVNQPKILDSVLSNGNSFRELVSLPLCSRI